MLATFAMDARMKVKLLQRWNSLVAIRKSYNFSELTFAPWLHRAICKGIHPVAIMLSIHVYHLHCLATTYDGRSGARSQLPRLQKNKKIVWFLMDVCFMFLNSRIFVLQLAVQTEELFTRVLTDLGVSITYDLQLKARTLSSQYLTM